MRPPAPCTLYTRLRFRADRATITCRGTSLPLGVSRLLATSIGVIRGCLHCQRSQHVPGTHSSCVAWQEPGKGKGTILQVRWVVCSTCCGFEVCRTVAHRGVRARYGRVNTAADGDDDAGWGDSDDNWDWDGADVEAGGGGGPSSGSGAGSGASAGASGSRASEAAAAPPRGASPAPVAATTAAGVDSGISMPSTASARSVSSVTIPTAGVGPAGGGALPRRAWQP